MNLDWTVAIAIFLMFTAWSIIYYIDFFSPDSGIADARGTLTGKVLDLLATEEAYMPVSYDSPDSDIGILYAEVSIPTGNEDGLRVMDGTISLPCMLTGNTLYWEAALTSGLNGFEIAHSDDDTSGCTDILSLQEVNKTFPLVSQSRSTVSSSVLASLDAVPYDNFRSRLGVGSNIRLEWRGPETGSYGPKPPLHTDISSREVTIPHLKADKDLTIRILLWE